MSEIFIDIRRSRNIVSEKNEIEKCSIEQCNNTFFFDSNAVFSSFFANFLLEGSFTWTIFAKIFEGMLQRIQTVYLLLAGIALLCMLGFPLAAFYVTDSNYYVLSALGMEAADGSTVPLSANWAFFGMVLLSAGLIIWVIFLYKDRQKQLKLIRLAYLLLAAMLVGIYFLIGLNVKAANIEQYELHYGPSYFLPIVAIILVFLASRGIKKDEELVKSLDRLR